jgi:hypothetical protein
VVEVQEDLKALVDNIMGLASLDVDHKAHAASVVLVTGIIESLRLG